MIASELKKKGTGGRPTTLLFVSTSDPVRLVAGRYSSGIRLLAGLLSTRLDHALANGCSPDTSRMLAARASELVSVEMRHRISTCLGRVVAQAERGPVMRNSRSALNRTAILACREEIAEVRDRLQDAQPVSVSGVAIANVLVTDGTGPIHNRRFAACELRELLRQVSIELDPLVAPRCWRAASSDKG